MGDTTNVQLIVSLFKEDEKMNDNHDPAVAHNPQPEGLTRREIGMLTLLSAGLTNKEIASQMKISESTVEFHLTNLYRKLNVRSRTEAVLWARQHAYA